MARGEDYSGFEALDDQAEEPVEETVEETVEEVKAKGPVFDRGLDGRVVDTNK